MRWLVHFWEFTVSKHLYSKRVSDVQPFRCIPGVATMDSGTFCVRRKGLDVVATALRAVQKWRYRRTRHPPSQRAGEAGRRVPTEETLFAAPARGSESQLACDFVLAKLAEFLANL